MGCAVPRETAVGHAQGKAFDQLRDQKKSWSKERSRAETRLILVRFGDGGSGRRESNSIFYNFFFCLIEREKDKGGKFARPGSLLSDVAYIVEWGIEWASFGPRWPVRHGNGKGEPSLLLTLPIFFFPRSLPNTQRNPASKTTRAKPLGGEEGGAFFLPKQLTSRIPLRTRQLQTQIQEKTNLS